MTRILFITANRVGDAVLTTGLLATLVAQYPQAQFTIACGPYGADLFRAVPRLERLIVMKKKKWVETDGNEGAQLDISNHDMRGTKLFVNARLTLMNANNAILYGLNLSNSKLQAAFLRKADMRHVNAENADMRGIDLTNARLTNANLSGTRFDPLVSPQGRTILSNLTGGNFRYANLSNCSLRQARLNNADLSYANLLGADLSGADLTGANLLGARMNNSQNSLMDKAKK